MSTQHSDLPPQHSYTTTHNDEGISTFAPSSSSNDHPTFKPIGPSPSRFADLHVSPSIPVPLQDSPDLTSTESTISSNTNPADVPPKGVVFRRTDLAPGTVSPLHRTLTVDYGVVVAGWVELEMESGEVKVLGVGDTIVQRGTLHRWRNVGGEGEWVRMVWVQMPIEELEVAGKVLKEEYRR